MQKYGVGRKFVETCICGYEETIYSEGVHVEPSGTIRVYDTDDIFKCPICEPKGTAKTRKAVDCSFH